MDIFLKDLEQETVSKKPTRKDLLRIIGKLQNALGAAQNYHGNDRDPNGFERGQKLLEGSFQLCIRARTFDPS